MSGRPRKLTDEQLSIVRRWKTLAQIAREWGVSYGTLKAARYTHYKSYPRKRA